MKTKLMIMGVLMGTFPFAFAEEPAPSAKPERPVSAAALKKFDKDGDGKLSPEEKTAMTAERKARMEERQKETLAKYDADKDGKLSDEEKAKAREDRKKEMIAKFDKDGDGKLSPEEREASKAERGARGDHDGPPKE